MGYYIRKSVQRGPVRLNLSKSGLGVSVGVPGFRVGTGPRGSYFHAGRGGLYYRSKYYRGDAGAQLTPYFAKGFAIGLAMVMAVPVAAVLFFIVVMVIAETAKGGHGLVPLLAVLLAVGIVVWLVTMPKRRRVRAVKLDGQRYNADAAFAQWEQQEHDWAQAWIGWHQDWRQRIRERGIQLQKWLKDHPEASARAEQEMKQAAFDWAGAATVAAADRPDLPELLEYAAFCGQILSGTKGI